MVSKEQEIALYSPHVVRINAKLIGVEEIDTIGRRGVFPPGRLKGKRYRRDLNKPIISSFPGYKLSIEQQGKFGLFQRNHYFMSRENIDFRINEDISLFLLMFSLPKRDYNLFSGDYSGTTHGSYSFGAFNHSYCPRVLSSSKMNKLTKRNFSRRVKNKETHAWEIKPDNTKLEEAIMTIMQNGVMHHTNIPLTLCTSENHMANFDLYQALVERKLKKDK